MKVRYRCCAALVIFQSRSEAQMANPSPMELLLLPESCSFIFVSHLIYLQACLVCHLAAIHLHLY